MEDILEFTPEPETHVPLPLAPGKYPFEVLAAAKKTSSAGNPMAVLSFKVLADKNKVFKLTDWFPITVSWKIKNYLKAVNRPQDFSTGKFNISKCVGEVGWCITGVRKNDQGYDKAYIKNYCTEDDNISLHAETPESPLAQPPSFEDEDLPF